MVRKYSKKQNNIEIGSIVSISIPGKNRPNSYTEAEKMGAKWFRGVSIYKNPTIYKEPGWYVVNSIYRSNGNKFYLIRNDKLQLDLIISMSGIEKIGDPDFFTDEDFLI